MEHLDPSAWGWGPGMGDSGAFGGLRNILQFFFLYKNQFGENWLFWNLVIWWTGFSIPEGSRVGHSLSLS